VPKYLSQIRFWWARRNFDRFPSRLSKANGGALAGRFLLISASLGVGGIGFGARNVVTVTVVGRSLPVARCPQIPLAADQFVVRRSDTCWPHLIGLPYADSGFAVTADAYRPCLADGIQSSGRAYGCGPDVAAVSGTARCGRRISSCRDVSQRLAARYTRPVASTARCGGCRCRL